MKPHVQFFSENIPLLIRGKRKLKRWIIQAVENEGRTAGDINIIVCDDAYLSQLNLKYLKHKSLTDILTFTFDDECGRVSGDIFISLPRVRENAVKFGQDPNDELHRVMIHGVLHLTGYTDKSPKEKQNMHEREDFYLSLFNTPDN